MHGVHINKAGFAGNAQAMELEAAEPTLPDLAYKPGLFPRLPRSHIWRRQS